jgi:3-deoxy-D-manno-octulosonate 8-phosphate phosphatase (KDO 8-P phosphatase)
MSDTQTAIMSDPGIDAALAAAIRLVILDVDGVLTDAGVYMGRLPGGEPIELKRFDIQDGVGVKLLQDAGVEVVIVSGRESEATTLRAAELGLRCYQIAGAYKLPTVERMLAERSLDWSEVAMLGDDLPDMSILKRVGLPAAVANATPEVMDVVVWRAKARGGNGAVREFVRALLLARGDWQDAVERYVSEREKSGS